MKGSDRRRRTENWNFRVRPLPAHKAGGAWKREVPAGRTPSAHPAGNPTAQAAEGAGLSVSRCFTMTTTPRSTIRPCAATISIQKRIGSCATM